RLGPASAGAEVLDEVVDHASEQRRRAAPTTLRRAHLPHEYQLSTASRRRASVPGRAAGHGGARGGGAVLRWVSSAEANRHPTGKLICTPPPALRHPSGPRTAAPVDRSRPSTALVVTGAMPADAAISAGAAPPRVGS